MKGLSQRWEEGFIKIVKPIHLANVHKLSSENAKKMPIDTATILTELHRLNKLSRSARTSEIGQPGRPKFEIPEEILRFLFDKRFTVTETATLLGVSQRTVERRMNEFGIRIGNCYSNINDRDLDAVVSNIICDFPNVGYKRMSGLLLSRGLRIQQNRVRETMRRVDLRGTLFRALSLRVIHRRRYYVPSPLSLWHVDGNHKLIRWVQFVTLFFVTHYWL